MLTIREHHISANEKLDPEKNRVFSVIFASRREGNMKTTLCLALVSVSAAPVTLALVSVLPAGPGLVGVVGVGLPPAPK